jgi:hypothetical protein
MPGFLQASFSLKPFVERSEGKTVDTGQPSVPCNRFFGDKIDFSDKINNRYRNGNRTGPFASDQGFNQNHKKG